MGGGGAQQRPKLTWSFYLGKTDIEGLEMRIGVQGSGESLMSRKGKEY